MPIQLPLTNIFVADGITDGDISYKEKSKKSGYEVTCYDSEKAPKIF